MGVHHIANVSSLARRRHIELTTRVPRTKRRRVLGLKLAYVRV